MKSPCVAALNLCIIVTVFMGCGQEPERAPPDAIDSVTAIDLARDTLGSYFETRDSSVAFEAICFRRVVGGAVIWLMGVGARPEVDVTGGALVAVSDAGEVVAVTPMH